MHFTEGASLHALSAAGRLGLGEELGRGRVRSGLVWQLAACLP